MGLIFKSLTFYQLTVNLIKGYCWLNGDISRKTLLQKDDSLSLYIIKRTHTL